MRSAGVPYLGILFALAVAGCTPDNGAPPPPADASPVDSGPKPDAGPASDSGPPREAGPIDAATHVVSISTAAGGGFSKSANYQMVWTLGQGPGNNAASSSSSHKMNLGVAGASQPK